MHPATLLPELMESLPDHTQLPDKDGSMVTNLQEHPQSHMFTECMMPKLNERHPDRNFCIGCDAGIYYQVTNPVWDGCRAPDWFYVPGVPPMLDGKARRSYVLWKEVVKPFLVVEYVSGDGSEEHDATPYKGKFWVYERAICAGYYVIFDSWKSTLEVFRLVAATYTALEANAEGRFPIEPLGIEVGIWQGTFRGMNLAWLRVWDAATGKMIPFGEERAEVAEAANDETRVLLAEQIERTAEERRRADRLVAKLRALGIDPEV